jgi:hypothetical protein
VANPTRINLEKPISSGYPAQPGLTWRLRPILAADENFSLFFAFIAKTRPKPPFGIPRALQPSKTNIIIFLVIFFRIDSHSTYHI